MSDTTSRYLKQAWRLTADNLSSDELPVSKLMELMRNLELVSSNKFLDMDSTRIIRSFVNENRSGDMVIKLRDFEPFFENLIGEPLSTKIESPKLNLKGSATSNFINKELLNLKNDLDTKEEDLSYRDNAGRGQLKDRTSNAYHNYRNFSKENHHGVKDPTNRSSKFQDQTQMLTNLQEQLDIQNNLITQLRLLQKDLKDQNLVIKSVEQSTPKLSKFFPLSSRNKSSSQVSSFTSSTAQIHHKVPAGAWTLVSKWKVIILVLTAMITLSFFEFLLDFFHDNILDTVLDNELDFAMR